MRMFLSLRVKCELGPSLSHTSQRLVGGQKQKCPLGLVMRRLRRAALPRWSGISTFPEPASHKKPLTGWFAIMDF